MRFGSLHALVVAAACQAQHTPLDRGSAESSASGWELSTECRPTGPVRIDASSDHLAFSVGRALLDQGVELIETQRREHGASTVTAQRGLVTVPGPDGPCSYVWPPVGDLGS